MADQGNTVVITLTVEQAEALKKLSEFQRSIETTAKKNADAVKKSNNEIEKSLKGLASAITPTIDVGNLAARAIGAMSSAISGTINAASEAEQAQLRFKNTLKAAHQEVDGTSERMDAFNRSLLQSTGVSDEALLGVESMLT